MKQYPIKLKSVEDIKDFVNEVRTLDCELDLVSGRYTVDAKSIMGVFSLDLTNPLTLQVYGATDRDLEQLESILKAYS